MYIYIYIEINPGPFFSTRALPSLAPLHPRSPPQWALALAQGRPCDAPGAACGKHLWKHLWKNYVIYIYIMYIYIYNVYIYIYTYIMTMWKHQWTCVKHLGSFPKWSSQLTPMDPGGWLFGRLGGDILIRRAASIFIGDRRQRWQGQSSTKCRENTPFNQLIPTRFTLW